MKQKLIPVMVRIRPASKELLIKAAADQRRSQASVVDTLIVDNLSKEYANADIRLEKFLKGNSDAE